MNFRLIFATLILIVATVTVPAGLPATRPSNWAQPMTVAGVSNCYQVTSNLYRGAQPTPEGMKALKAMGIKTVVNLRSFHSDQTNVGLKGIRVEMKPWHATEEEAVEFLKIVTNTNNLPVFVHCQRGADRTGTMCAMYRIAVCGWTKQDAIKEMKEGGFEFSPVWKNLVHFIETADVAKIKQRAGLSGK